MAHAIEINVLLVGDPAVGKSTYINRLVTGHFVSHYQPTENMKEYKFPFGNIVFNIFDGPLVQGLTKRVQFAIIMFDVTNRTSYDNAFNWRDEMRKNGIPYVIVGNKMDKINRIVQPKDIQIHKWDISTIYYDISAKSNYNFEKPFLYIARRIMGPEFH